MAIPVIQARLALVARSAVRVERVGKVVRLVIPAQVGSVARIRVQVAPLEPVDNQVSAASQVRLAQRARVGLVELPVRAGLVVFQASLASAVSAVPTPAVVELLEPVVRVVQIRARAARLAQVG